MSRPVSANGKAGIAHRITLSREKQRQERNDERAKLVEEHAEEQDPRRARQRFQTGQQGWVCGVHGKQKTLLTFRQAGLENLGFVELDWPSLLAGSVIFPGDLPGHAAAARLNDNVRDGARREKLAGNSRCHYGAETARNFVVGQAFMFDASYGGSFHFAAGELGPDPVDLPIDMTYHLTVN